MKGRDTGSCEEHEPLTKTVRLGLIKPLGGATWEEVGPRLRDMNGTMHRLLNAGIRAAATADGKGKEMLQASRSAVKLALEGERVYWAGKGEAFEGSNHDPGKASRMQDFTLPSVVEDTVAATAASAFADAKKHMVRGDKSIPSFNRHAPIFFRDGHTSWSIRKDIEGRWEVGFKLGTEARGELTWFAAGVSGGSAHADLKMMISGVPGVKLGNAKIVRNERRTVGPRGKRRPAWEALLTFSFPPKERTGRDGVVAAHRGIHNMLVMVSTGANAWEVPGDGYRKAKEGFTARRRSLSQHTRRGELGGGARGRGTARRYKALDDLGDAEARMIKTACQQAAARLVEFALHEEAGRIAIEDYQTIEKDEVARYLPAWPWAQLKSAIEWAAKKAGLVVFEVPSAYISVTCPCCGEVSAASTRGWTPMTESQRRAEEERARSSGEQPRTHQIRMFCCDTMRGLAERAAGAEDASRAGCGLERNVDHVAAWNMLLSCDLASGQREKFKRAIEGFARQCRERSAGKLLSRESGDEAAE